VDQAPEFHGQLVGRTGRQHAGGLATLHQPHQLAEAPLGQVDPGRVVLLPIDGAGEDHPVVVGILEAEAQGLPARQLQLAQRVAGVAGHGRLDARPEVAQPLGGDGGDERLLVGEVGVRGRVADAGPRRHRAERQGGRPLPGQDLHAGPDQRVLEIAVVVAPGHPPPVYLDGV